MPVGPTQPPIPPAALKEKCWIVEMYRYEQLKNSNDSAGGLHVDPSGIWMGIPEMLVFNLIMGIICVVFFTFFRKWFWDYGRIAWRLFTPGDPISENNYDVFSHTFPLDSAPQSPSGASGTTVGRHHAVMEDDDVGICTWLYLWAELTDEEILIKCGPSAVQYLQFQNVLIAYLSVVTSFSLMFLLPLNKAGSTQEPHNFGMTTIANLSPDDSTLFVHCVVAVGFFVHGLYMLRIFARSMHVPAHWRHYKHGVSKIPPLTTIMISDLPPVVKGKEDMIMRYFSESYPNCPIEKVQFAYDVHELDECTLELKQAETALKACEQSKDKKDELITTRHCRLLNCLRDRWVKKVAAKDFYKDEIVRLKKKHATALRKAKQRPLPICFVTFKKNEDADRIANDFQHLCRFVPWRLRKHMNRGRIKTSIDHVLRPGEWKVILAPKSTDIAWENLSNFYARWLRIVLNVVVLILLFCLSTPSVLLSLYIEYLGAIGIPNRYRHDPSAKAPDTGLSTLQAKILGQLVPTVIQLALTALLPYAIEGCEEFSRHEVRSAKESYLMVKTFVFELCMILILPTFGLMSGLIVLESLVKSTKHHNSDIDVNRWECWFLPDSTAFFVNFVIMSSMFGAGISLIRPGHIVYYLWKICRSRSHFELESAREASIFKFPYGSHYAHMLAIFATIMAYCIVCPVIAPCGFLYFCLKNQVDRYNIYFAFDAHYVPQQMHRRAANMTVGCCLFSQLSLIAFTVLRSGGFSLPQDDSSALVRTVFMLLSFAVSLALFFWQLFSGWFFQSSEISPFQYCLGETDSDTTSSGAMFDAAAAGGAPVGFPEPSASVDSARIMEIMNEITRENR